LELGVKVLLIDEDTSATNLLYKDECMTKIIVDEPIKPLSYVLRGLINTFGISLVIVSSASSSFIPCATKVIEMVKYEPKDITEESKRLMAYRSCSDLMAVKPVKERIFGGIKDLKRVKASGFRLNFRYRSGEEFQLDLRLNPRIVEPGQVKLICKIITKLAKVRKPFKVRDIVNYVNSELRSKGFNAFTDIVTPDLTMVDGLDVVLTLNRV
ncbi:MAG TPA: ATP-binding protein, partial [Acidilobales archaeon]|nr:ATP-binding protein [Acidilobales archaeon]